MTSAWDCSLLGLSFEWFLAIQVECYCIICINTYPGGWLQFAEGEKKSWGAKHNKTRNERSVIILLAGFCTKATILAWFNCPHEIIVLMCQLPKIKKTKKTKGQWCNKILNKEWDVEILQLSTFFLDKLHSTRVTLGTFLPGNPGVRSFNQ